MWLSMSGSELMEAWMGASLSQGVIQVMVVLDVSREVRQVQQTMQFSDSKRGNLQLEENNTMNGDLSNMELSLEDP